MEGLKYLPYIAIIIAISGVIIGAGAISLNKFGDTVDKCWNSSWTYNTASTYCENATPAAPSAAGPENTNLSWEMYSISQGSEAEVDLAEQLPTMAIIAVMIVIISIIAGVFVYMRFFR